MPYTSQKDRNNVDAEIDELLEQIKITPSGKTKGCCNYVISRLVAAAMKPEEGWNYAALSSARGIFTDAGEEFARRLMAPYEDEAINKNGDIPEYSEN